jgi:transcriptional regulator with XRE-family HTH domain
MHFKKLNATQLADILQVQRSSISHILTGRNKPSLDFVQKVINEFPEVSYDWLINGAGNLSRSSVKDAISSDTDVTPLQTTQDTFVTQENVDIDTNVTGENPETDTSVTSEKKPVVNEASQVQVNNANNQEKNELPRISKVIIFYEDGSYQEIKHQ